MTENLFLAEPIWSSIFLATNKFWFPWTRGQNSYQSGIKNGTEQTIWAGHAVEIPTYLCGLAGTLPDLSHFEGWICGLGTSQRVIIGSAEMAQHPSFAGSPPTPTGHCRKTSLRGYRGNHPSRERVQPRQIVTAVVAPQSPWGSVSRLPLQKCRNLMWWLLLPLILLAPGINQKPKLMGTAVGNFQSIGTFEVGRPTLIRAGSLHKGHERKKLSRWQVISSLALESTSSGFQFMLMANGDAWPSGLNNC